MLTSKQLMNSLPQILYFTQTKYRLSWKNSRTDSNRVIISYVDEYSNVLKVGAVSFYIEAERHYATYLMIQCILGNSSYVLRHLVIEDTSILKVAVNTLSESLRILEAYIQSYDLYQGGSISYGEKDYITIHA